MLVYYRIIINKPNFYLCCISIWFAICFALSHLFAILSTYRSHFLSDNLLCT